MHYELLYLTPSLRSVTEGQIKERLLAGKPGIARYSEGKVLPCIRRDRITYNYGGGVVDKQEKFVDDTALHEPTCLAGGYYATECVYKPLTVIYVGFFLPEWGNTITDTIKKIWFLHTREAENLISQGAKVVYVTFENRLLKDYQKAFIRLAGFNTEEWVQITVPTRFKEVIVPENSLVVDSSETRRYYNVFVEEVLNIKENALRMASENNFILREEKIYLTRTQWNARKDYNEQQIEKVFRELGFRVMALENMKIYEQITLLAHCRTMAATEGSVSHNALFMPSGSELIILQKADYVNDYQHVINAIADLNVTYITCHHSTCASKDMPWAGPFYLTLTPEFKKWCGLSLHVWPCYLQPKYWFYRIYNSVIVQSVKLRLYLIYIKLRRWHLFDANN